jgi:hypothetical protein
MKTIFKYVALLFLWITIYSCSSEPSHLYLKGEKYSFTNKKESTGGKFNIYSYSNKTDEIHLIKLHENIEIAELTAFSKLYTETFKAQGFSFSSEGNEHIGRGKEKVIYLTVSPKLEALSILIISNESPVDQDEKTYIFQELQALQ